MCGIFGIVGDRKEQAIVELMRDSLRQRGPDDSGTLVFGHCVLGHTRLSIIDLDTGRQPILDPDINLGITFNGEIYNYRELRKDLERKGYLFRTKSDTEVVLKCYIEFGSQCPQYLDGMFAFAIWSESQRSLFLARDRFGKKPLFYSLCSDGGLIFASEIKALKASKQVELIFDHGCIDQYIQLMFVPPWRTVYKNVHTLKPGHSATFVNGQLSQEKYWRLEYNPIRIPYNDAKVEVREHLLNAVRKRLVADVEVGALLSGGVDSTLVTYLAQSCGSRAIKTFAVGYEDYINELPYALEASQRIGTEHHTLQARADCVDQYLKVTEYLDEPHADSSNVSQYMVSDVARRHVKVALCGDGGDEVFLGYEWYWSRYQIPLLDRIKKAIFSDPFQEFLTSRLFFSQEDRKSLWMTAPPDSELTEAIFNSWNHRSTPAGRINYFDLTVYLPGQLLTKADRAGMMCSLEVRAPFLDSTLVQYVYNLPEEYKTDRGSGKLILRDLLCEIMPRDFVDRKKQGFGAPVRNWLQMGSFRTLVYDLFVSSDAAVYQFLNRDFILDLIEGFYIRKRGHHYKIWILLCLEIWLRTRGMSLCVSTERNCGTAAIC